MNNEKIEHTNETTFRKIRPDDVLGNLPPEKKNMIVRWLGEMSYEDVLKRIAEPEPEGLGIETHYNSLRRFYMKNLPEDLASSRRQEMIGLRGLAEVCEAEPAPYDTLIREFFTKGVFYQSVGVPHRDPNFRENMRLLLELRAQELKEKHLELQKARFESDKSKSRPDANFQIFAAFQAQMEQVLTQSLSKPERGVVSESSQTPLIGEPTQKASGADSNENAAAAGGAAPDTEKHALTPNNTI